MADLFLFCAREWTNFAGIAFFWTLNNEFLITFNASSVAHVHLQIVQPAKEQHNMHNIKYVETIVELFKKNTTWLNLFIFTFVMQYDMFGQKPTERNENIC